MNGPQGAYWNVAVTTSGGVVLSANAHRRYLLISNPTGNLVYIALGRAATAGQDICVPDLTKPLILKWEDIGGIICTDIYGIIATANGTLAILEGSRKFDQADLKALAASLTPLA